MPRHFLRDELAPAGQAGAPGLAGNRWHAPEALLAWRPERAA